MNWLKQIFFSFLAILLLIEEWLWGVLTRFGGWVVKRLRLQALEAWLAQTTRWVALVSFLVPLVLVMPLNLVAFWLIAKGMVLYGVLLEVLVKLLATVLVARVFALTKPQLLTFRYFAWLYHAIMRALAWAHRRVVATVAYKAAKRMREALRRAWFKG